MLGQTVRSHCWRVGCDMYPKLKPAEALAQLDHSTPNVAFAAGCHVKWKKTTVRPAIAVRAVATVTLSVTSQARQHSAAGSESDIVNMKICSGDCTKQKLLTTQRGRSSSVTTHMSAVAARALITTVVSMTVATSQAMLSAAAIDVHQVASHGSGGSM
eukprot:5912709-Prymnesium_polylepis.1